MGRNECLAGMDFMKDWKTWRTGLHDAIQEGRKYGMTDEEIKTWAVEVGDYLAKRVCAGTPEEALLKELWDVATPEQRKTLAALIFQLVG
jgi:hypothetical protein